MRKINPYIRLLRPQHWVKNLFVFVSPFFSGKFFEPAVFKQAIVAYTLFCLLASAVYIFNDLCDAEADRQHLKKDRRPIAAREISIFAAVMTMIGLLVADAVIFIAGRANPLLLVVFAIYAGINILYSLGMKNISLIELFMVASGFVLRLIAGAVAVDASMTSWILICTGLVSLLLVVGKRRADIALANDPSLRRKVLKSYSVAFLDSLIVVIAASTLVTYFLFCTSTYGLTRFGLFVNLTGVFVALGIFRFMQIVMMEGGGDAPTMLVIKDKVMVATLLGWAAVFFGLLYGEALWRH
jgi:4-hydroxybenzoate polyprenyltransferase